MIDDFKYDVSAAAVTGLRMGNVLDSKTGVSANILEFNPEMNISTFMAWLASQTSRRSDMYQDLAAELWNVIRENPEHATQKLTNVFVKYGHGSVADMAPAFGYINNIPMIDAFALFNAISVLAGQELSSRYVLESWNLPEVGTYLDMTGIDPEVEEEISLEWNRIRDVMLERYQHWFEIVEESFIGQFASSEEPISKSTMKARILDVSRMWIPVGSQTSMSVLTSVRSWIDIIVKFRESHDPARVRLGDQLHAMLSFPENSGVSDFKTDYSGLTKYSEAKGTIDNNLAELGEFLESNEEFMILLAESESEGLGPVLSGIEMVRSGKELTGGMLMLLLHIKILYPGLSEGAIQNWLTGVSRDGLSRMGRIISENHDDRDQMGNAADIRSDTVFAFSTAMAYLRDLNRHRSMQRLVVLLETGNFDAIVKEGFTLPIQFTEISSLKPHAGEWVGDMNSLYEQIRSLYDMVKQRVPGADMSFITRLLPLGHNTTMYMSGSIKHVLYTGALRIREGGDMGYRVLAFEMLRQMAEQDPVLDVWLEKFERPDLESGEQFRSRK